MHFRPLLPLPSALFTGLVLGNKTFTRSHLRHWLSQLLANNTHPVLHAGPLGTNQPTKSATHRVSQACSQRRLPAEHSFRSLEVFSLPIQNSLHLCISEGSFTHISGQSFSPQVQRFISDAKGPFMTQSSGVAKNVATISSLFLVATHHILLPLQPMLRSSHLANSKILASLGLMLHSSMAQLPGFRLLGLSTSNTIGLMFLLAERWALRWDTSCTIG